MTDTTTEFERVGELIAKARFAFVTTSGSDGRLLSRPLAVLERDFDGDLYFFTMAPSAKTAAVALAAVSDRKNLLVVVERNDAVTWKSLRNLATVHLLVPDQLNTYDVLCSDAVVFTEGALATFLEGPRRGKGATAVASSSETEA